jgi:hypothetical protein
VCTQDKQRRKQSVLRNELALLDDFVGMWDDLCLCVRSSLGRHVCVNHSHTGVSSSLDALAAADERAHTGDAGAITSGKAGGKRSLSQLVSELQRKWLCVCVTAIVVARAVVIILRC